MKSLSKQKGLVPLVLMLFVAGASFVSGIVVMKTTEERAAKMEVGTNTVAMAPAHPQDADDVA